MRFLYIAALVAPIAAVFDPADVSGYGTPITKTTTRGPVTGRVDSTGIERYFGIPTSPDMGGARRWTRPTLMPTWTTAIETVLEKPCMQARGNATNIHGSEDCVSVDVMTYSTATNRPVVFWTHGGGFTREDLPFEHMRSAYYQKPITGATYLTDTGRIVTVLNHYRLSTLGWFVHRGLNAENAEGASGNYGLMDSIHNLEWVRDNIATFGGDPTRVTVMGESAGGAQVTIILATPAASSLIHNVIIESPFISFQPATYSRTARYSVNTMTVNSTGCGPIGLGASGADAAAEIACLRALPFAYMSDFAIYGGMAAYDAMFGQGAGYLYLYSSIQCWPVVDDYLLPRAPYDAWASGTNAAVHVIIGHNADEYSTFYPDATTDYEVMPYTMVDQAWNPSMGQIGSYTLDTSATAQQVYQQVMGFTFSGSLPPAGLYAFPTDPYQKAVQKTTDAWFTMGVTNVVNTLNAQTARRAGTVYRFLYANDVPAAISPMVPTFGACHGCELDYVLGLYEENTQYFFVDMAFPVQYTAEEITMGQTMKKYWVHMMTYGHPNRGAELPRWHPDGFQGQERVMVFQQQIQGGAAMQPCIRAIPCRAETTGGDGGFRSREKAFWGAVPGWASLSDNSCDRPVGGLSQLSLGNSCPAIPAGTCETWCNVHTCADNSCQSCDMCVGHNNGQTCEGWCNSHTCDMEHCHGCGQSICPHGGEACESWCNRHTCGDSMCEGCTVCGAGRRN